MGWFLWSQIGRKVHGTISLRNPWSEVWDVISWHQNRNTQVIEEWTNRRPPDRKKYDTLTWGPTGRKEDLDNVTKEKERERERQRKELQIYICTILRPKAEIRVLPCHFISVPKLYWLASLFLWFWKITYVPICLLYQSDPNPVAKTAIDGKMLLYTQHIAASKCILLSLFND